MTLKEGIKITDSDLRNTPFSPYIGKFPYEATVDEDEGVIKIQFDSRKVDKEFADKCSPMSKNRSDSLYPYITSYNNRKVTMELPVSKKDTDSEESMMTPVQVKKRASQCDKEGRLIYESESRGHYKELDSKTVPDSDGFLTEYTLYHDLDNDTYITIFGDRDLYTPDDTEPDAEFDDEGTAREWFDSYEGIYVEEEDEYDNFIGEDYWFGGDGKIDSPKSSSEDNKDSDSDEDSQDSQDEGDSQDDSSSEEPFSDDTEDDIDDDLEEGVIEETPGLTLSEPEIVRKDQDDIEGRLEISINGKTYRYRSAPESDKTASEIADSVSKIKKHSDGKALAYLKKNMQLVQEGISEVPDQDIISSVTDNYGTTTSPYKGPSFILPNGEYLDIKDKVKNHADVEKWLVGQGLSPYDDIGNTQGSPSLKRAGCIRVDTPKYYVQLPYDNITGSQYSTLKNWVDYLMTCNVPYVEIIAPSASPVKYHFDESTDSKYIIERVRRYYMTGTLYEDIKDNKVSFKDVHICDGCGKPLSQCTCEVDSDEDKVNEELSLDESVDNNSRSEVIHLLTKINTEASEALYKFKEMDDAGEARDILYYLLKDTDYVINYITEVIGESLDYSGATQPSSIGQHKLSLLDPDDEEE